MLPFWYKIVTLVIVYEYDLFQNDTWNVMCIYLIE